MKFIKEGSEKSSLKFANFNKPPSTQQAKFETTKEKQCKKVTAYYKTFLRKVYRDRKRK